jgi:hypothetical protein
MSRLVLYTFVVLSNLFISQLGFAQQRVRIYSREEFVRNFQQLSDIEVVVNFAEHFSSVNYSAGLSAPVRLSEILKVTDGFVEIPEQGSFSTRLFG